MVIIASKLNRRLRRSLLKTKNTLEGKNFCMYGSNVRLGNYLAAQPTLFLSRHSK